MLCCMAEPEYRSIKRKDTNESSDIRKCRDLAGVERMVAVQLYEDSPEEG